MELRDERILLTKSGQTASFSEACHVTTLGNDHFVKGESLCGHCPKVARGQFTLSEHKKNFFLNMVLRDEEILLPKIEQAFEAVSL